MSPINIGIREIAISSGHWKIKVIKLFDFIFGSFVAILLKKKSDKDFSPNSVRRILIIRPGGIGDAIFLLPFLKIIRQRYPQIDIDILCEKRNEEIFLSQKDMCHQIYCYDRLSEFLALLKNNYDLAIDTEQWHYSSALLSYFLKISYNIGFATRPLRAKLFNQRIDYKNDAYEIENFAKLFQPFFDNAQYIKNINSCFEIPREILYWAQGKILEKSISLFLGASIPERRLTKSQSLELLRFILDKNFLAVILGSNDVRKMAEEITKEIPSTRLLNFAGQISLQESAALIQQSKVFIGADSGLMHLACAVGATVIAIFGPGNLKKWAPQGENHIVITENVECSPCTKFSYTVPTCHGTYHCMRNIKLQDIFSAIVKKTG